MVAAAAALLPTEKHVFVYWQGPEPSLIRLLRRLMVKHSNHGKAYRLHVLNPSNLRRYLKDIPDSFYALQPAHKADYIRVNVLCQYGGIWLDADTLVMNNLHALFKVIQEQNGFFILEDNVVLCNGVFGTRAGTELMIAWRDSMEKILSEHGRRKLEWTALGSAILTQLRRETPDLFKGYHIFKGLDTMYPVNWDICVEEFIKKPYENYKELERPFQPLIVLIGELYRRLRKRSEYDILHGDMPLSYFLRKSLGVVGRVPTHRRKTRKNKKKE